MPLPLVSVIIPVWNAARTLPHCLAALQATDYAKWECVVVDDGSGDGSRAIARRFGARVVDSGRVRGGPAGARNRGAAVARGEILLFLDADVVVRPGTVGRAALTLHEAPDLAACFGSYDADPAGANFLSQYKNLLHHYTHQSGREEATTFWAGCGAIRRDVFLAIGGFDTRYRRASIEDIELGVRLRAAGHRIRLDKGMQVTHLKRWSAPSLLRSDVWDRALPWSRLIVERGALPDALNLQRGQRWSAVAVLGMGIGPWVGVPAGAFILPLLWLNRGFYQFLLRHRGPGFLLRALPWHWFYFLYSSLTFAAAWLWHKVRGRHLS